MACGRAVACSNTSAMPEVADGAGILFNPHEVEEITRVLTDLLLDAALRLAAHRVRRVVMLQRPHALCDALSAAPSRACAAHRARCPPSSGILPR